MAMRAVAVSQFGELPKVVEASTPVAGPGQVLIKLAAASMNPMDAKVASGEWRPAPVIFPMVLGVDGAGYVETVGEGTTRFVSGDKVFGQLFIPPIGASGTYAEYVAVSAEAPLACVPDGLDLVLAAAAPTAGGTGLSLVDLVEPLEDQVVLIIGAGGGVGTFATQFAVHAGASVIANINALAEERMRSYGVSATILRSKVSATESVRRSHPDGVDVLIDLVSDAKAFATMAGLVRPGGTAITTQYVADLEALQSSGIRGVNFALRQTSELMDRVGQALTEGTVVAPPISRIDLDDVPAMFGSQGRSKTDCKTVIVL
jgi:NADPH:quinone reductase